jgi:glycosyltransferase involved in cell wall biosynthesis
MRTILIDATCVAGRLTGIERYTQEITKEFVQQAGDHKYQFIILLSKKAQWLEPISNGDSVKIIKSPFSQRIFTEQVWIPYVIHFIEPSFALFLGFPPGLSVFFLRKNIKIFKTVYDANMWLYPETLSLKNKFYMRPLELFGMHYYNFIFTISESSLNGIVDFYPRLKNYILNAGCGIDIVKFNNLDSMKLSAIMQKYNLSKRYILFVGTLEPRKNLPFLISVLHKIKKQLQNIPLIIVGRQGWGAEDVIDKINEFQMCDQVRILGTVNDDDLPYIYKSASMFLFPSIYEGFGLPVLEAMAAGIPVIASNTSSIPEVAGRAALLLSPYDKNGWTDAILKVLGDENLRNRMIVDGFEQMKKFNWSDVATRIINTIKQYDKL